MKRFVTSLATLAVAHFVPMEYKPLVVVMGLLVYSFWAAR